MEPTKRQQRVLNFIRQYYRQFRVPPTIREIGAGLGIKSPNGVMCHVRALERKGFVYQNPNGFRWLAKESDNHMAAKLLLQEAVELLEKTLEEISSFFSDSDALYILGHDIKTFLEKLKEEPPDATMPTATRESSDAECQKDQPPTSTSPA